MGADSEGLELGRKKRKKLKLPTLAEETKRDDMIMLYNDFPRAVKLDTEGRTRNKRSQ